jgi:dTDP-4-dehydrorhamnose 3,5-epimerase
MKMLGSSRKDQQTVTPDWTVLRDFIDGVSLFEIKNVLGTHSRLTEMFRPEWDPSNSPVAHVYQVVLHPGNSPDWNCHQKMIDRLFFGSGQVKLVLFDGRESSVTFGRINEFHLGEARPGLVTIPPGVWHALQCRGTASALVVNLGSIAYQYDDPDHYRLPPETPEIPYKWSK